MGNCAPDVDPFVVVVGEVVSVVEVVIGVTVELVDAFSNRIVTTTDENGFYYFLDIEAGFYYVSVDYNEESYSVEALAEDKELHMHRLCDLVIRLSPVQASGSLFDWFAEVHRVWCVATHALPQGRGS